MCICLVELHDMETIDLNAKRVFSGKIRASHSWANRFWTLINSDYRLILPMHYPISISLVISICCEMLEGREHLQLPVLAFVFAACHVKIYIPSPLLLESYASIRSWRVCPVLDKLRRNYESSPLYKKSCYLCVFSGVLTILILQSEGDCIDIHIWIAGTMGAWYHISVSLRKISTCYGLYSLIWPFLKFKFNKNITYIHRHESQVTLLY